MRPPQFGSPSPTVQIPLVFPIHAQCRYQRIVDMVRLMRRQVRQLSESVPDLSRAHGSLDQFREIYKLMAPGYVRMATLTRELLLLTVIMF